MIFSISKKTNTPFMKYSIIIKMIFSVWFSLVGVIAGAQLIVNINNGPVQAFSKYDCKPSKRLGKSRLYLNEKVWLKKGDWLVAKAGCHSRRPVSIDVYDRVSGKYVSTNEDTVLHTFGLIRYRSELIFQANRTDTFDVLFNINYKNEIVELENEMNDSYGFYSRSLDTASIDYTIAILNQDWQPKDTSWGFQQRLSYICNNWTAGFSTIPKTYDKNELEKYKKILAYYPTNPVPLDNQMAVSLQLLDHGNKLIYFMYSKDEPYVQAKKLYDELFVKLKAATDKYKISNLSDMRRINELATTYFMVKIPYEKKPFEFYLYEDAGKGFRYLPINLFLYGNKQSAKVIVAIGEGSSDVYDIVY